MADPYFGVEIVETGTGSAIVTDRPAATALLVGTAPIDDAHDAADVPDYVNTSWLVRDRETAAELFGEHVDGFTIPAALDAIFDQAGDSGVGEIEVINVYDPTVHTDGPADVTSLDIIGSFSAAGIPSGLKMAYASYQKFGRFNKILLAPGFTLATGVRAELETICSRTRARAIIDAPVGATLQEVIEARGPSGSFGFQFSNRRLVACWPHMEVVDLDGGGTRLDPYSSRLAGVWLRTIVEEGYHHSPSNREILGIEDTEVPVTYIPGDASSDVQSLRAAGIVTIEERWGKGPHTSGNRSSAYPTDTDMRNFLHVQFTEDMIHETVLHYLDQFKDRAGTLARIEFIEERVNNWLHGLVGAGILSGARFAFDRTRTTSDTVANGQYFYRLEWAPIGVMERITVDANIDLTLLGDALGLAA